MSKLSVRRKLADCTIGIMGDSYSTFLGYIPEGRDCFYPVPERVDDVLCVEDTWWHQLMQKRNMTLLFNDSWSGATVCTAVRETQPLEASFVMRMTQSLSESIVEKADCVFLFGGTNDSWLEREIGQIMYQGWTEQDLLCVLPAFCYMLDYVTKNNPDSCVICVLNTQLDPKIHMGILEACRHYGVVSIELHDIDKKSDHPSRLGMKQIAEQIDCALELI